MSETATAEPNADQVAYWNSDVGQNWATFQDEIDAMFAPLTQVVLDRAAARLGENVVDIGCGCGATVIELARRVGPQGSVLGVDVSAVMLARAAERIVGLHPARLIEADASTHPFARTANLVFSRFGVMFFDDPVAAFANIRQALAPGGRLVMAVWRPLADNDWANVPLGAALPHLPPQAPSDPHAPGPFAFADPNRVGGILAEAGFSAIAVDSHDTTIVMGGPGEAALAAARAMRIGPVARAVRDADQPSHDAAEAAIRAEFTRRQGPDGVVLGGAIWLISAAA